MARVAVDEEDEAFALALQICSSTTLSFSVKTAIELRLLDVIVAASNAALSPAEIVARLPTAADNPQASGMVDRLLRLLAAHGIVTCVTDAASRSRKYAAAPVSKYLIVEADGTGASSSSMADLALLFQDKSANIPWEHAKDLVLHGVAAVTRAARPLDDLGSDSQIGKTFDNAMGGYSSVIVKQLLPIYHGFDDVEVLADVGGGNGTCLRLITAAHPHVKGINFDIESVISQAPPIPGVEHVSGDMFESVPTADAIFMKWILHTWGDEECVKILKNCWKVLPENNGKVIVVECLLPVITEQTAKARAVLQMDLQMLACLGGKERSEEEFKLRPWRRKQDFKDSR